MKNTKIFTLAGFIIGCIFTATKDPYFIGVWDFTSFIQFIAGGIPLSLISCFIGLALDKYGFGFKSKSTCPYCKESIAEDAIKCKHCGSNLEVNVTK